MGMRKVAFMKVELQMEKHTRKRKENILFRQLELVLILFNDQEALVIF
jgi:hypothetical protein